MKTIYVILNVETWDCYVGATTNPYKRWSVHKARLKFNKHHSSKLQDAYNSYGPEAFCFLEVDVGDKSTELAWISCLDSQEHGYNMITDRWSGDVFAKRSAAIRAGLNDPLKKSFRSKVAKLKYDRYKLEHGITMFQELLPHQQHLHWLQPNNL